MDNSRKDKVSPLTKILVDKVHDGRKQDSKFWRSEFSDSAEGKVEDGRTDIAIEKPAGFDCAMAGIRARRSSFAVIIAVVCAAFALVSLRPDLFPFLTYSGIYNTISNAFPEKEKIEYLHVPHPDIVENSGGQQVNRTDSFNHQQKQGRPVYGSNNSTSENSTRSKSSRSNDKQWLSQEELNQIVTPEVSQQEPIVKVSEPTRTVYEIELYTGATIYTDNAMVSSDKVTYTSSNGLITSINKYEVKSMRRMKIKL